MVLYTLVAFGAEDQDPELGKAVGLFLAASGLTASVRLFSIVFGGGPTGVLNDADRIYLAVGALGAFWVSFGTIVKTFAAVSPEEAEQPESKDTPTIS